MSGSKDDGNKALFDAGINIAYIGSMTLQILLAEDTQTFANSVARFLGLISGAHSLAHVKDGDEALEKPLSCTSTSF